MFSDPEQRLGHRHLTYRLGKFEGNKDIAFELTAEDAFWWA